MGRLWRIDCRGSTFWPLVVEVGCHCLEVYGYHLDSRQRLFTM